MQLISGNSGRHGRTGSLADALNEAHAEAQILDDDLKQTEAKLDALMHRSITEEDVRHALTTIDPLWDQLFPSEQNRSVRLLVDWVEIQQDGMEVTLCGEGLGSVVGEITAIFEKANGRNAR